MPGEIAVTSGQIDAETGLEKAPLDLSTIPGAFLEHHMADAFSGATFFTITPELTIDAETLAGEYQRRCLSSDFNRP